MGSYTLVEIHIQIKQAPEEYLGFTRLILTVQASLQSLLKTYMVATKANINFAKIFKKPLFMILVLPIYIMTAQKHSFSQLKSAAFPRSDNSF